MPKQREETVVPPQYSKEPVPMRLADLTKRSRFDPKKCEKPDLEFDVFCDPVNPKTITKKDVFKATAAIRKEIYKTPLMKSKSCAQLGLDVHFKLENFSKTGSFHDRGALYALQMLKNYQRDNGVYTASTGNWAKALAYKARRLKIPVNVVLPKNTRSDVVDIIKAFRAKVDLYGRNLAEAKRQAFDLIHERGSGIYINGDDHPHVIAAAGSIGVEILHQLPKTDAILIPVGGGGLLAGIAAVVKKCNPNILIYGIEPNKSCCFFKALDNELPYKTDCGQTLADSLAVPCAGYNAFHTARALIDKMVLVDDDWISQAILRLADVEKVIAEGAAASTFAVLLAKPNILPELQNKTVVCLISGGNVDLKHMFPITIQRALVLNGQIIKFAVKMLDEDVWQSHNVLHAIACLGASVLESHHEKAWINENEINSTYWTLVCETKDLKQACKLKKILQKIYPGMVDFVEEPFCPIPVCVCLH